MEYQIEKNVPLPAAKAGSKDPLKAAISKMEVNDSILVPDITTVAQIPYPTRKSGRKVMARKDAGGGLSNLEGGITADNSLAA